MGKRGWLVWFATAIDDLCGKPGEQRLRAFCTVTHVELAFCLCAADALSEAEVESNDKKRCVLTIKLGLIDAIVTAGALGVAIQAEG